MQDRFSCGYSYICVCVRSLHQGFPWCDSVGPRGSASRVTPTIGFTIVRGDSYLASYLASPPPSLSLSCAPSPGLPTGKSSAALLHRSGFLHRRALHTQNKYYLLSRPHRMLGDHPGATTGPYIQSIHGCYSCLSAMASHGSSKIVSASGPRNIYEYSESVQAPLCLGMILLPT